MKLCTSDVLTGENVEGTWVKWIVLLAALATILVMTVPAATWYLSIEFNKRFDAIEREQAQTKSELSQLRAERVNGVRGPPGPDGPKGDVGPKGDPGPPGSVANVRDVEELVAQLSARVKALEANLRIRQGNAGTNNLVAPTSSGEWQPGECFPTVRGQPYKTQLTIELNKKDVEFCLGDRTLFMTLNFDDEYGLGFGGPGLSEKCMYEKWCRFNAGSVSVALRPQRLAPDAVGRKFARVEIDLRP